MSKDDDPFETVFRTFDPIEVEIVADILAQNGIEARALGTRNGALIGVGQGILTQRIEVRASRAAEARELIEAFVRSRPSAAAPEPATGAPAAPEARARRSPILAAGAAFVLPGGGHIYARRHWSGLVILVVQIAALVTVVTAREWTILVAAGQVFMALLAVDLVGAQLAVRQYNRGRDASTGRQVATTLAITLCLAGVASIVAPRIPEPLPPEPPDGMIPFHLTEPRDLDLRALDDMWPLFARADGGIVIQIPPAAGEADGGP